MVAKLSEKQLLNRDKSAKALAGSKMGPIGQHMMQQKTLGPRFGLCIIASMVKSLSENLVHYSDVYLQTKNKPLSDGFYMQQQQAILLHIHSYMN